MELVCHRCSVTLEPDGYYCQNCGAPQIYFAPQDDPLPLSIDAAAAPLAGAGQSGVIHWKVAIQIAAWVAVGVGILSTVLAAGSVLWVAIGAVVVIGTYHRRHPNATMGRNIGARIGAMVGLLAISITLAGNAVFLVIQRYGMHQGNLIDSQLTGIVKQAAERAASMDPQAPVASFTNFWLSPEGRIGLILMTMGFLASLILLFAIAGGVLGAQIYRSPRNHKPLS